MRASGKYREERLRRAMKFLCDNNLNLAAARKAGKRELFMPNTSLWVTALGKVLNILELEKKKSLQAERARLQVEEKK